MGAMGPWVHRTLAHQVQRIDHERQRPMDLWRPICPWTFNRRHDGLTNRWLAAGCSSRSPAVAAEGTDRSRGRAPRAGSRRWRSRRPPQRWRLAVRCRSAPRWLRPRASIPPSPGPSITSPAAARAQAPSRRAASMCRPTPRPRPSPSRRRAKRTRRSPPAPSSRSWRLQPTSVLTSSSTRARIGTPSTRSSTA